MFSDTIKARVASAYGDPARPGELLTMGDGSQWFHPYSGGAPVKVQGAQMDADAATNIYLSAVNEGDCYRELCAMGAAAINATDSAWVHWTRHYAQRLLRERRMDGWPGAQTITGAAMALRDHFISHAAELRRAD